ncbi:MAG: TetR/AcrR family transcriptional regulator [Pseudohongiella sp.]|uniref:TetR/AcrR family transcriptional regulator n=1 Tax=Pseudohongiella sp. TaxID=1979412 RepID=UPI0034A0037A
MTVRRRRAKEKQERHDEILDAAELTFFEKGYEQTSMDDIARAAQLSRALLYVYFKDKAAIMRGVMLRAAQSLQRRFECAMAAGDTGVAQIEGIGHAYHAFSVDEANYFDVLTSMATFPGPDETDAQLLAMDHCRERVNDLMVQALQNGIRDGSLSAVHINNPLQTAFYLQGALHGVIMQTRGAKSPQGSYPEAHDLIKYTIAMLTNSIEP